MSSILKRLKDRHGFTLVELIVVLVILAILMAILIPSFTGYIDKANGGAAKLECRNVLQAVQTDSVEWYADGVDTATAMQSKIMSNQSDILTLAEAGGSIEAVKVSSAMRVTELEYRTANGTLVKYDINANELYTIVDSDNPTDPEDPQYSNDAPGYTAMVNDIKSNTSLWDSSVFLNEDGTVKDEYKQFFSDAYQVTSYDSRRMQAAFAMENGGAYPAVDWSSIPVPENMKITGDSYVWVPIVAANGDVIMTVAWNSFKAGNVMAYAVYYNGTYYFFETSSTACNSNISDTNFDISSLVAGEKFGNNTVVEVKAS